ncbi:hypothetical protein F1C58_03820 [Glaciihabitans sp. INWT7]|uniref:hypothetical protein n=1 Tax=Glaciihabitans sp. INWT7 TaxID=2596912 RepID=UPI0016278B8A|nr:hypothetical protein [Glaciihabitans sp. INWT7]QNE46121.1 hypothetical protein F1C58_03820 [Glaciihabitans sp. INWT7]
MNANANTRRHAATFETQDKGFAALIRKFATSSTRSRTNAADVNAADDSWVSRRVLRIVPPSRSVKRTRQQPAPSSPDDTAQPR